MADDVKVKAIGDRTLLWDISPEGSEWQQEAVVRLDGSVTVKDKRAGESVTLSPSAAWQLVKTWFAVQMQDMLMLDSDNFTTLIDAYTRILAEQEQPTKRTTHNDKTS